MKRGILYILFCFGLIRLLFPQDNITSHFFVNSIDINPAFTGTSESPRLELNYRNQWPGLNKAFITCRASYDQKLDVFQSGLGFQIFNESIGGNTLNITKGDIFYSYYSDITRSLSISFGLVASIVQNKRNYQVINNNSLNNIPDWVLNYYQPENGNSNKISPDFSVGFLGIYKNLIVGIAAHHILEPNISDGLNRLQRKYSLYLTKDFKLNNKFSSFDKKITPAILIQLQDKYQNLTYGFNYKLPFLSLGMFARQNFKFNSSSIILTSGINYLYLYILYSYDIMISQLNYGVNNISTHEISIITNININKKGKKIKTIKCPKI